MDLSSVIYLPLMRSASGRAKNGMLRPMKATYPSGGGLYPVESYVVAINIDGLETGGYHCDSIDAALTPLLPKLGLDQLAKLIQYPIEDLEKLMCVVVQTAVLERSTIKYGNRGYRFALLEAGHASQNVLLACAAAGFGALLWGGAIDAQLGILLNLNPADEVILSCILVGKSNG